MAEFDMSKIKKTDKTDIKERTKAEPVIKKGSAKTKKKSEVSKLASMFFPGDVTDIKKFFVNEVIIPNLKKAITDGVDMLLYGETGKRRHSSGTKVSYSGFYSGTKTTPTRDKTSSVDFDDIIFDTRGDAELVLSTMEEAIEMYGFTTVAEFYDLAGISTSNYMLNKHGWNDLRMADIRRTRDGFVIKFPRPLPIEKF